MLDNEHFKRINASLPFLKNAEPEFLREFKNHAYFAELPRGKDIFAMGDRVDAIALLISGVIRVYRIGETGREITLYRFGEGESCILSANAILNNQNYPAIATVEHPGEAVLVPADSFNQWMDRFDSWRSFVFDLLSRRITTMMEKVQEVAFQHLDHRIADLLEMRSRTQNPVRITHQEIANELGSSREVISRLLKDFSERGLVELSRGEITVLDPDQLKILTSW